MKQNILFFFCIILVNTSCAQQLPREDVSYIDSIMNTNYKKGDPGAVILIAKDGKPIFRKAYGMASLELSVANKPEHVFRIGSMTKQFTAVCILKLAQEGKLSLQDDIRKYLPDFNTHGRTITVDHLLSHTSGIPGYTDKSDFVSKMIIDHSKEEVMSYFMEDSLLFEPNTQWRYSNSGYFLAGLIVEKVSKIAFEEYLQRNIFDPLGMSNSHMGTYEKVIPNAVYGYSSTALNNFIPASYLSWSWPLAAGAMLSTVDDLLKWDNALYTNKIVNQEWLEKAWTPYVLTDGQVTNYGFGWSIGNYEGLKTITHGGGINGFRSDGIRIPSEKLYVVILSNSASVNPGSYSTAIASQLAGRYTASK